MPLSEREGQRMRAEIFEEAARIAISHSNYGSADGNQRAFRIAADLTARAKDIRHGRD